MSYSVDWNESRPPGRSRANLLDTDIQDTLKAVGERLNDIFFTTSSGQIQSTDPYRPRGLYLNGSAISVIIPGSTSFAIRNSSDTANGFLVEENGNVTIAGNAANDPFDLGDIGGTQEVDWNNGNNQEAVILSNTVFTFVNPTAGGNYFLRLQQGPASTGFATWPSTVKFSNGATTVLSTTVARVDGIGFYYDGSRYLAWFVFKNVNVS